MELKYDIEKIHTKTDLPTLKVNNFFLHSKYDPIKEAEQFANSHYIENHVHILFGFGLGYFARALKEKFNDNDHLLIFDPLSKQNEYLVSHDGFEIINNITDKNIEVSLNNVLKNYSVNVKIICSPNYNKIFPNEYNLLLKKVKDIISVNTVFYNTVNFFAETWQENYIKNLFHVFESDSLYNLEKQFDLPVVIASGGPSLTKQIPLLKKNMDNIILIAAGSTVNTLLHYGIEADFIVSIDGSIANFNHFNDHIFQKSNLIYSIRNHYKIREQFKTQAFSFIPSFEPGVYEHIDKITQKKLPTLLGGASVANYALSIAEYISTGPIALIGQDLAYTDNKTHADYNKHLTNVDETFKKARHTFFTEGYNGEEVLTDTVFLSMKKSFEQLAYFSGNNGRLFNCTEGGAKIEGYKHKTFQKFCEDIANLNVKKIKYDYKLDSKDRLKWEVFYKKIYNEIREFEEIARQLNIGLCYLRENASNTTFSKKVIEGLNKVDSNLKEMFNRVSMNSIIEPITMEVLKNFLPKKGETKEEEYKRVFEQNDHLYNRLLSATNISRKYTEELLEQVKMTKLGDE